ncbi:MAG: NUDIX hydrolase [Mycobacteriaceae bacterium]
MPYRSTAHEVLVAVFQVRCVQPKSGQNQHNADLEELCVLLWQRALEPQNKYWALPGGQIRDDENLTSSAHRQLAEKVDVQEVAHLEQLSVFSEPNRIPEHRTIASTFLGLIPSPADPHLPADTAWHPVSTLPAMAFDHQTIIEHARTRLAAKLSYTTIGFALAPQEFAMSTLRKIYTAALGYHVDATNLQRVLLRRSVLTATGTTAKSGKSGGRPPALFRFTDQHLLVTDEFAALRPPNA